MRGRKVRKASWMASDCELESLLFVCQVKSLLELRASENASYGQKKEHPDEAGVFGNASVECNYSLSEAGSDRFLGDFLLSTPISSWAAGGTATAPLRTIASASTFLL